MNLHALANGVVRAINPNVAVSLKVCTGYATDDDGRRTPSYAAPITVQAQAQALTFSDLSHIDGLNLMGLLRAVYLSGQVKGVVRAQNTGGDILTFPDNSIWTVVKVVEQWSDGDTPAWVKVIVCRQDNA